MLACKKGGKEREAAGKSQITKPCSRSLAVPSPSVHSDPLSRKLYTALALHWPPLWMCNSSGLQLSARPERPVVCCSFSYCCTFPWLCLRLRDCSFAIHFIPLCTNKRTASSLMVAVQHLTSISVLLEGVCLLMHFPLS